MNIYRSNGTLSKQHFSKTGLPYIQYGQIHTGKFLTQDDRYITYIDPQHCSDRTVRAQAGDLLLTGVSEDLEGLCRPLLWQGEEVILSQSIILLKFKSDQIDPLYLAYFFKSYDFYCQKYKDSIGVTIHNISADALRNMHVTVPPLHIQQAIGKFLSKLEELFASKSCGLNRELELRKKQFKFYIEDLKCLFPQWNNQLTNTSCTKLKQLDLELIRYVPLKKLTNLKLGRLFKVTGIQQSPTAKYPLYSSATENMGEVAKLDTYDYDGEFLTWTSRGANTGEIFYRNEKFSITNLAGLIENTSTDILSTKYLYAILKAVSKSYVNQGGGLPMLNVGVMEEIEIPIIPLELQEQIGDFVINLEKLINNSDCSLDTEIALREKQLNFYIDLFFRY